jgi:dCMP deaminase
MSNFAEVLDLNNPLNHHSYMRMAQLEAQKSPDESNKVGCIIRRGGGYDVLGVGFNRYPENSRAPRRYGKGEQFKYDRIIHAEMMALIHAQDCVEGATLYTTCPPCSNCAKHICEAGISRVIVPDSAYTLDYVKRFRNDVFLANQLLGECGIANLAIHSSGELSQASDGAW